MTEAIGLYLGARRYVSDGYEDKPEPFAGDDDASTRNDEVQGRAEGIDNAGLIDSDHADGHDATGLHRLAVHSNEEFVDLSAYYNRTAYDAAVASGEIDPAVIRDSLEWVRAEFIDGILTGIDSGWDADSKPTVAECGALTSSSRFRSPRSEPAHPTNRGTPRAQPKGDTRVAKAKALVRSCSLGRTDMLMRDERLHSRERQGQSAFQVGEENRMGVSYAVDLVQDEAPAWMADRDDQPFVNGVVAIVLSSVFGCTFAITAATLGSGLLIVLCIYLGVSAGGAAFLMLMPFLRRGFSGHDEAAADELIECEPTKTHQAIYEQNRRMRLRFSAFLLALVGTLLITDHWVFMAAGLATCVVLFLRSDSIRRRDAAREGNSGSR